MKEHLRELVDREPDLNRRRSLVREYLQARLLQILQDRGAFQDWAFLGGTALRFIYGLPRYSEDLDFSLVRQDPGYSIAPLIAASCADFAGETYAVEHRVRETGAVKSATLRFGGLLHEMGVSSHRSEVLAIKVELDARPPDGAGTAISIVRRHVEVRVLHHDQASLLAGKLHAILTRAYTKGRDLYDLTWYLSDRRWPAPNLQLLNNVLRQTGRPGPEFTVDNWRRFVARRLDQLDWNRAVQDVRPFLERPQDAALLTRENLRGLLA